MYGKSCGRNGGLRPVYAYAYADTDARHEQQFKQQFEQFKQQFEQLGEQFRKQQRK